MKNKVKELRKEQKLTQEELADLIGFPGKLSMRLKKKNLIRVYLLLLKWQSYLKQRLKNCLFFQISFTQKKLLFSSFFCG